MNGFICPVCAGQLTEQGGWRCSKGHSFDKAKEGYVNLLMANRMNSKTPGDSKEMVAARHRFLQSEAYRPFAEKLAQLCAQLAKTKKAPLHILDAGCGEGYYDSVICQYLTSQGLEYRLIGFDISKTAVRLAAKRNLPNASFAVASSFAIPVQDGWADVVLNVFSPFCGDEFLRCLTDKGSLLYAVPTAQHLMGLKKVLYDTPYENPCQQVEYPGFTQAGECTVEQQLLTQGQQVQDLFAMTPYYWKTPPEGTVRLKKCESLQTTIGFRFLFYVKKETNF